MNLRGAEIFCGQLRNGEIILRKHLEHNLCYINDIK